MLEINFFFRHILQVDLYIKIFYDRSSHTFDAWLLEFLVRGSLEDFTIFNTVTHLRLLFDKRI